MVTLTTTQHSALGDLHRFGRLYPPGPRQHVDRGTSMGFSKRTLDALVAKGFARWDDIRDGCWVSIVPVQPCEQADDGLDADNLTGMELGE